MKLLTAYNESSCADAALDDLGRAGFPHSAEVLVLSVADVLLPPSGGTPEPSDSEWVVAVINKTRARCAQAVEEARTAALGAIKGIRGIGDVYRSLVRTCKLWARHRRAF